MSQQFRTAPHEFWLGARKTIASDAFGGALLVAATLAALILANSPAAGWYEAVRDFRFGIPALHLELSVGSWAADGLLTLFFFVVGLELKEEFVAGRLRDPRAAALPIAAAFGGVAVPALLFLLLNRDGGADALHGWAVPTATDIAFSAAVLAIVGRHLPSALRVFLLTLAIVDDLIAIVIIAAGYTQHLNLASLALALIPLALFAVLVQSGRSDWWLLIPLAMITWGLVHDSGIHPTIAGVALGFTVPVAATPRTRVRVGTDSEGEPVYDGMAAVLADRCGLVSTLVAVPLFAFFSAGVAIGGAEGFAAALGDPVTAGVIVGLVVGKPIGILGTTFALTRLPGLRLDPSLRWSQLAGISALAGMGFTVSLLVSELAFGEGSPALSHAKIGILLGSLVAALAGSAILVPLNRRSRREAEPPGKKKCAPRDLNPEPAD